MNMTDEEIKQVIRRYEKRLIRDRENYQRVKDDPEFIKQNRERASNYYYANKEKKKQHTICIINIQILQLLNEVILF